MTDAEIAYVVANEKYKATASDFLNYLFLILPLAMMFFGSILVYDIINPNRDLLINIGIGMFFVVSGLILFMLVLKRLKQNRFFKKITTGLSKEENYQILISILSEDKMNQLVQKSPTLIICCTKMSSFSWGEIITAIPIDQEIFINSHPDGQPITIIKDLRNIQKLEKRINAVSGRVA